MPAERSMFLEPNTFDVHVQKHGSGYEGIHVQVKNWTYPKDAPDTILISRDALSRNEFDLHIDELIGLLNDLRKIGHKKLDAIDKNSN